MASQHSEAHRLGYKFSETIFFEKLALAFPRGELIADMETFCATMRRPNVQAAYKAEYERCENPKRGAILKLFEVAGVDTRVVRVSRRRCRSRWTRQIHKQNKPQHT